MKFMDTTTTSNKVQFLSLGFAFGIAVAGPSLLEKSVVPIKNLNSVCAPSQDSVLKILFEKFNLGEIQADYPISVDVEKSINLPDGKLDAITLSSEYYFPPGLKPFFFSWKTKTGQCFTLITIQETHSLEFDQSVEISELTQSAAQGILQMKIDSTATEIGSDSQPMDTKKFRSLSFLQVDAQSGVRYLGYQIPILDQGIRIGKKIKTTELNYAVSKNGVVTIAKSLKPLSARQSKWLGAYSILGKKEDLNIPPPQNKGIGTFGSGL